MQFIPERVFFEPASLDYPLGRELYGRFRDMGVPVETAPIQSAARRIPGNTEGEKYARSKKTLAVAVNRGNALDICKPSADFEFSLVSNCPGNCEYCYLQTTQGSKPYLRVYVNLEDIFKRIEDHIAANGGRVTTFEVASMGDPLSLEDYTGSLGKTIEFFGGLEKGRLRVVTKFDNVDSLLGLKHNGHTRFRFSINSRYVIETFEHNTAGFLERLEAASKIAAAGYPTGFILAPIMVYEGWKEQYEELFTRLSSNLSGMKSAEPVTFELIQHRFTAVAKKYILARFPKTKLDMDESKRAMKWGRFGRYKYIYPKDTVSEMKAFITGLIKQNFPDAVVEYFT